MDAYWKIILPVAGAIIVWCMNEWSKRKWERHKRKEDRCVGLLKTVRGFREDSEDIELRKQFLQELQLAWLYCPDSIINPHFPSIVDIQGTGHPALQIDEPDRRWRE